MALPSFDAFFHGVPLPISPGVTKQFDYWFKGSPLLIVDVTATVNTYGLQMRARIVQPTTPTIQSRARISRNGLSTISLRAYIKQPKTIMMQARVARTQGWPVVDPFDPAFPTFQATQLTMRARINQGVQAAQSLDMRANIRRGGTSLLRLRARIVTAARLSMRARIKPFRSRTSASMTFLVANARQSRALMLFYTQGNVAEQTISMRARIAQVQQLRVASTFIVSQAGSGSSVLTFDFDSAQATLQQLSMQARIVAR